MLIPVKYDTSSLYYYTIPLKKAPKFRLRNYGLEQRFGGTYFVYIESGKHVTYKKQHYVTPKPR